MSLSRDGIKLIICQAVLTSLATIAVCLRVLAIRVRRRTYKAHDLLCFFSLINLYGYMVTYFYGAAHGGIGYHIADIQSPDEIEIGLKVFYASAYTFSIATAVNRLSMLLLYVEVFRTRFFLTASKVVGAFIVAWLAASILTNLLLCRPISLNWDKTVPGICGDIFKVEFASASWNLILDLTLVVLPMPVIWGLQMSRERRLGISVIFGLGVVIACVNIGRIAQTATVDQADFTYAAVDASILAVAEVAIGIIVICAPTLGPLFRAKESGSSGATSAQQALRRIKPYGGFSGDSKSSNGLGKTDTATTFSSDKNSFQHHRDTNHCRGTPDPDDIDLLLNGPGLMAKSHAHVLPLAHEEPILSDGIRVQHAVDVESFPRRL